MKTLGIVSALVCIAALSAAEPADWEKAESAHLRNIRQLTFPAAFARAGEGYFSPDGKTIIFQAEEKGSENPFYQIFTMDLASGKFNRVSTGVGKTTCSYFSPDGKKIIFASTHLDPKAKDAYAVEKKLRDEERKSKTRRRYSWDFDSTYDIFEANPDGTGRKQLTHSKGYDAEGTFSPDGKHIVFCSNRSGPGNFELYIMDCDGKNARQLTHAPGCYNGGPFFSPDGKRVIFRADRKKKDQLQLYVIDADGKNERLLTDDLNWVQWGPTWYKDGKHIIYAGADHGVKGRPNYDLYWLSVPTSKKSSNLGPVRDLRRSEGSASSSISLNTALQASILYPFCTALTAEEEKLPRPVRITHFPGADVLPVFSPDGKKLMWTSNRTKDHSSQLFIADFTPPTE